VIKQHFGDEEFTITASASGFTEGENNSILRGHFINLVQAIILGTQKA